MFSLVTCSALKCGASPVPPTFTADGFMWEFRAGSPQPHPIGLFIRWATLHPSLSPYGDIIGNFPIFSRDFKVFKSTANNPFPPPLAYPRFEKRSFASNDFIMFKYKNNQYARFSLRYLWNNYNSCHAYFINGGMVSKSDGVLW